MIEYPKETQQPQITYVLALGGTGGEIVHRARIAQDFPAVGGHSQFRLLHIDTSHERNAEFVASVPDGQSILANGTLMRHVSRFMHGPETGHRYMESRTGARTVPEAYLASVSSYTALRDRIESDLRGLIGDENKPQVRVFVVAWTGRHSGSGLLPVVLAILADAKAHLAQEMQMERWLFLTQPALPMVRDQHVELLTKRTAVLAVLTAAQVSGIEVYDQKFLKGPIAEFSFLIGAAPGSQEIGKQIGQAAAILRLLADPGALGNALRGRILSVDSEVKPLGLARGIGLGSMLLERPHLLDLLADLALGQAHSALDAAQKEAL